MKVYRPGIELLGKGARYCLLTFLTAEDHNRFAMGSRFRGSELSGAELRPYAVRRSVEFEGGATAPLADRQGIGFSTDPMALSERALQLLAPFLGSTIQTIPLEFNEGRYSLVNIMNLVDCLDVSKSVIEVFPSSGRINRITKYAFRPHALTNQLIFKVPQTPRVPLVTDRFVELSNQFGLTGFNFEELWSDEG